MKKIKFSRKHIDIFKKLGVAIVYLFGSQAEGRPGPMSDFDIGVVFTRPEEYRDNTLKAYSQLYDIFVDVLPKNYLRKRFETRLHEFDLVFLQFAPVSMQYKASKDGIVLYQNSLKSTADYKERAMHNYFDFRFIENIFNEALIQGATSI
jgi:predicted nucleotidyltransferase